MVVFKHNVMIMNGLLRNLHLEITSAGDPYKFSYEILKKCLPRETFFIVSII